jgi:hypothetical protein
LASCSCSRWLSSRLTPRNPEAKALYIFPLRRHSAVRLLAQAASRSGSTPCISSYC